MQISQAQVQMTSHHSLQRHDTKQESLRLWVGDQRPRFEEAQGGPASDRPASGDRLSLSTAARALQFVPKMTPSPSPAPTDDETTTGEDPRLTTIRLVLEAMTGRKIRPARAPGSAADPASAPVPAAAPGRKGASEAGQTPTRAGWGLAYDAHLESREQESTSFRAQGRVTTVDGRDLAFDEGLVMQRQEVTSTDIHLRAGDARLSDPLVINFAEPAAGLAAERAAFDLDQDGRQEEIPLPGPGSGFLSLDRNQDGRPTDGGELFGPGSGNGFAELARLDSDANGWLDDQDPMFAKLMVWARQAGGSDYLVGLKSLGIGAILLDHRATPFTVRDAEHQTLGQVTDSGLFLREDGSSGTVQNIRLAV